MKKSSSIRLFFIVCTLGCCMAYCGGYYFSIQQSEKSSEKELAKTEADPEDDDTEEKNDTMESAAVVTPYEYVLCEEDGYVVVYYADRETVYANTDIRVDELPEDLQKEIAAGKQMYSESELYNFLESHTS